MNNKIKVLIADLDTGQTIEVDGVVHADMQSHLGPFWTEKYITIDTSKRGDGQKNFINMMNHGFNRGLKSKVLIVIDGVGGDISVLSGGKFKRSISSTNRDCIKFYLEP